MKSFLRCCGVHLDLKKIKSREVGSWDCLKNLYVFSRLEDSRPRLPTYRKYKIFKIEYQIPILELQVSLQFVWTRTLQMRLVSIPEAFGKRREVFACHKSWRMPQEFSVLELALQ